MKRLIIFCLILSFIFTTESVKKKKNKIPTTHQKSEWLFPVGSQLGTRSDTDAQKFRQQLEDDSPGAGIIPLNLPHQRRTRHEGCEPPYCLSYMDEGDSYFYLCNGGSGDTTAVVFQPLAPCTIEEVYVQWFSAGLVTAFGADYGSASEISPNGDCYDIPGGSTNLSPIGTIRTTPTTNLIPEYISDWSDEALVDIGGTFQVGNDPDSSQVPPFVIALVKQGDTPQPLAMYNGVTGRTETYTWFGGPWNANDPGLWGSLNQAIDLMMAVRVSYEDAPPICTPSQLSNTYLTSGPRTLKADCFDDIGTDQMGITPDDNLTLFISRNGVITDSLTLADATPYDIDQYGNGTWQFDLDYLAVAGDEISYRFRLISDYGMFSYSQWYFFDVLAPINPDADLLFIADGTSDYYVGGYEQTAEQNGYVYEVWNTNQNNGIDSSVINHGWSNIIMYGWGTSIVPVVVTQDDHGFDIFIASGGNLMLIDQDWFYGIDLIPYPLELILIPGDPAYDWFGIASAFSDPDDDDNQNNGGAGDTMLVSLLLNLPNLELHHGEYGTNNWGDFLTPGTAEPIYQGMNTGEIFGVRQDNGLNKTAFFSFMADASADSLEDGTVFYTQEFYNFMSYFLDWLEIDSPPHVEIISGPEWTIYNQSAQEIQASVSDNENDPFTVALEYSVDDAEWLSVDMVEIQPGIFSGWIPGQNTGYHIQYRVAATDDDGTFRTPSQWYNVYSSTSDVLFVLNSEMSQADYPGMYYLYDEYGTGDLWLWPDFWTGSVTTELLELYNIVFDITTTRTWVDFTDHYDVVQEWLSEGGKRYFLAGDETFGLVNGTWADEDFSAGSFFYDMGVAHSYNDLAAGGTSELNAVENDLISGDLYNDIQALGDGSVLMYDPGYEVGTTNYLDGFEPSDEAIPFLFDEASGHVVGAHKQWPNGNRTIFCGFDPLSLNSSPTYVWWGASESGITKKSLDWFFQGDCSTGDLNGDGLVNVLDVVLAVACILGTVEDGACGCDFNFIEPFDVLDIVILVAWILG
ncbi:MAG: hypothetical protein HQ510_12840 [Candidatus Marinimicrobia bacterium]|nr:hypothetical protein [Candidatus Neomarinimicrobiota bacterium]